MRACPRCSCLALVCALLTSLDLINARSEAAQYQVTVTQRSDAPLISFQGDAHYPGNSPWPQNFNPSWVQASSGTGGVEGLIIRAQNCSFAPGICTNCNVDDKHPIAPYFPGSVLLFAQHLGGSVFAPPYLIFSPSADAPQDETNGTEDPRIAFDAATGAYHLFYTCYGAKGPILCHAISSNPTLPHPGHWQRMGAVFPGMYGSKSAALLIKPQPPHVLLWGDSSVTPGIAFATSNDLLTFTTINTSFITPRPSYFDSYASCLAAANLQPCGSISPPASQAAGRERAPSSAAERRQLSVPVQLCHCEQPHGHRLLRLVQRGLGHHQPRRPDHPAAIAGSARVAALRIYFFMV